MRFPEFLLLAGGASCLSWFLLRTLAPYFRDRLERTADRAARELRGEFLHLSPRQTMLVLLAAGGLSASLAMILTRDVFWAATLGIVPSLLSGAGVRHFRSRRRKKIVSQLPGFLDVLAGHVRAGHSIPEALSDSIPLLPRGIREEVSWLFQLNRLGVPLAESLLQWERRMPCDDVSLAVRPLRMAIPAGGNIVDLLTRCRDILRARQRMEEKMRSLTAQARLQAVVLTCLPPAFVAVLSKVDDGFLPRCLGTPQGKVILASAALLQTLGWLTIRRILAVKP